MVGHRLGAEAEGGWENPGEKHTRYIRIERDKQRPHLETSLKLRRGYKSVASELYGGRLFTKNQAMGARVELPTGHAIPPGPSVAGVASLREKESAPSAYAYKMELVIDIIEIVNIQLWLRAGLGNFLLCDDALYCDVEM